MRSFSDAGRMPGPQAERPRGASTFVLLGDFANEVKELVVGGVRREAVVHQLAAGPQLFF